MIVDTIKSVVSELDQNVQFVYGNIYETNYGLDNIISETEWFFVYIAPFESNDKIGTQRELHTDFNLQAFIVKRLDQPTTDYVSEAVQPIIDQAREIGRNFIHKLGYESVIDYDPTYADGIKEVRYLAEYGWQDTHLFGIQINATVPIYEGKTGC